MNNLGLDDIVNNYAQPGQGPASKSHGHEGLDGLDEEDKIKDGELHEFILPEPDNKIRQAIHSIENKIQKIQSPSFGIKTKNILEMIIMISVVSIIGIILFTKLSTIQKDIHLLYKEQQKTYEILDRIETFIEDPQEIPTPAVFIDVESFRKSFITKILADDKNKTKTKKD